MTKSSKQFLKCNYKFLLQKAGGEKKAMRTCRESAKSHHTLGREFCCHLLKQRAATWKCYRHFWNPLSSLHIICCYLWFSYFPVKSVLWTKGQIIKTIFLLLTALTTSFAQEGFHVLCPRFLSGSVLSLNIKCEQNTPVMLGVCREGVTPALRLLQYHSSVAFTVWFSRDLW